MQTVSSGDSGDSLHEISNPIFWEKYKKYHQFVVCWICPQHLVLKRPDLSEVQYPLTFPLFLSRQTPAIKFKVKVKG